MIRGLSGLARPVRSHPGMRHARLLRTPLGLIVAAGLTLAVSTAPAADPPADHVLQLDRYASERGRALGQKYQGTLRDLSGKIFHCMPWLDVQREGIGFYKPKHLDGDVRYLTLNVAIDQRPTPEFVQLSVQERVSAMFSRYVPHLLRSMVNNTDLLTEPLLDGFTVIVSWLKVEPPAGRSPVFETVAAFMLKALVADHLRGRASLAQLAEGAGVLAWDGDTQLGSVTPRAWVDDFMLTYRVAGYTPDPKVTCP